jgi:periplasmic divalent cation tolerance protein
MSVAQESDPIIVAFMTAPDADVAKRIGDTLVNEKLVACMNVVPGLRSLYRWKGQTCDDSEVLCLLKTRLSLFPAVRDRVVALHPYEVPELIALPVVASSESYAAWVQESTTR